MPGTNFIDKNTVITAVYMNGVDAAIYDAIGNGVSPPSSQGEVKANLSLDNVDNTSDINKPISTATQTALNSKIDSSQLALKSDITTTVTKDTATGQGFLPTGTTAQRPTPVLGGARFNTSFTSFEIWDGSTWNQPASTTATQTFTNKTLTAPKIKAGQFGDSATATQNFTLTAEAADGTLKLARGNAGVTTQDIITVDVNGHPSFPQGGPQLPRAFCIFDGVATGTNAPLAGFGVTSITRNSAGNYTINLANTYSDNVHIISLAADNGALNVTLWSASTTSSVTIVNYVSGLPTNAVRLYITIWRAGN